MTAIAGFHCADGLLVCADMEESSGYSKRSVRKLYHAQFGAGNEAWEIVIGGAGSAIIIDNVIGRLGGLFARIVPPVGRRVGQAIEEVLLAVHKRYIWPNKSTNHEFRLLIGLSPRTSIPKEQRFITTVDIVPAVEHQASHVSIGVGADMVNYFADRLFTESMASQEAIQLATFIFREVKEAVSDCGKKTEMWFLPNDGVSPGVHIDPKQIEELENLLPDSTDLLGQMWTAVRSGHDKAIA
jgi:hypothetical protein